MKTVRSADGTTIAFGQLGRGPALILVDGALGQRAMDGETAQLAPSLSEHFTVFHYDRRGRGDSTDTPPYAVAREIEDIDALVTEAGGSAFLFGISSGAALALEAAIKLGDKVKKLAMYEAPYNDEEAARLAWKTYRKQLADVLARGCKGDALALFMLLVGMPPEHLDAVRQHPLWPMWEAVAPTLAYDAAVMGGRRLGPNRESRQGSCPNPRHGRGGQLPFYARHRNGAGERYSPCRASHSARPDP